MTLGRTAVVTGASSGIGRATARELARQGHNVVVAARRKAVLDEVASECRSAGGNGLAVETDVTQWRSVEHLASAAVERFGGIDVWVNNAGVGAFGPFPEGGIEVHRRVVETNLIGTINGTAAALPIMRERGAGLLVALSSIGGLMATPYAATYAASKAGIRAFMASLREELRDEPEIHACTVLPSFVDTPGIEQHGANVSGRELKPSGPAFAPEEVARRIAGLVRSPKAELDLGWATTGARIGGSLSPWLSARIAGAMVRRYLSRAARAPQTTGNVLHSIPEGTAPSGSVREKQ